MSGTIPIREGEHLVPDTARVEIDHRLASLKSARSRWEATPVKVRAAMLDQAVADTLAASRDWVEDACRAKGIKTRRPVAGEEWQSGPGLLIRNLRLLARTLRSIESKGHPPVGKISTRPEGTVAVKVFPADVYDRVLFPGISGEVWLEDGVGRDEVFDHMASTYRRPTPSVVGVVLGAGNLASIPPMDAIYKSIVENQVVMVKMNPVNGYLAPHLERSLGVFINAGLLTFIQGGAEIGEYLVSHPDVETIHITGSDNAHHSIVFGPGPEGEARRRERSPRLTKRITSELGNVTPVIVVPGEWSNSDLTYQGRNIAAGVTHNAGYNCIANRVIVNHSGWGLRDRLLESIRSALDATPIRPDYYPGSAERLEAFVAPHDAKATRHGKTGTSGLPWTLIADLGPDDRNCFDTECFSTAFVETALTADTIPAYIDRAVEFCNDRVYGTLGASILVHPDSLKDPEVSEAVDRAIRDLQYGTVAVNLWAAVTYAMVTTPWGAYPGHTLDDIGSGIGVVHNALMFDRPVKAVAKGPFRSFPKPPWFSNNRMSHRTLAALTELDANPGLGKLVKTVVPALFG